MKNKKKARKVNVYSVKKNKKTKTLNSMFCGLSFLECSSWGLFYLSERALIEFLVHNTHPFLVITFKLLL